MRTIGSTQRPGRLHTVLAAFTICAWLLPGPRLANFDPPLPAGMLGGPVIIDEFVAANHDGLLDEDGDSSDWIELYNASAGPVNLSGWSLTDDPAVTSKWLFPSITLPSHAYLVIFASGKERATPGGQLHTNFVLDAAGEYLALFDAASPPQASSIFSPAFPRQVADISYGLYAAPLDYRYFGRPTPGAANDLSSAYLGVVGDVNFAPQGGYYAAPLYVALSCPTPGAEIRYTRSSDPPSSTSGTLGSEAYVYDTLPVRAIASRDDYLSSPVATHSYIMPSHVVEQPANPSGFPPTWGTFNGLPVPADYAMDPAVVHDPRYQGTIQSDLTSIPALSLVTSRDDMFGPINGIYSHPTALGDAWERAASLEMITPDGARVFQVDGGVRIHGGIVRDPTVTPKHAFRIYFRDEYGATKLQYPIFPDSPVDQFDVLVLDGMYHDSWIYDGTGLYLRDQFIRDTQVAMDRPSTHGIYVHLYIDGLYWGLYNLVERLDEKFAVAYFGGADEDYDVIRGRAVGMVGVDNGDVAAWNSMMEIAEDGLADPAQYAAVQQYLDVANLADYMLVHIYAGTYDDWPDRNWTAIRRREPGAGFKFMSWDNAMSLKYVDWNNADIGADFPNSPAYLYWRLQDNAEFRLLFADRVQQHFFDGGVFYVDPANPQWDPAHPERNVPAARFAQRAREIAQALVPESARWGDWKIPGFIYNRDDHWIAQRDRLLTQFFPQRSAIVLQQLRDLGLYPNLDAPTFNQHGGAIPPGFQLTMSAPSGAIYFTTDGSDPRVPVSGAVSPTATRYTAPITLPGGATQVKARSLDGATWSALADALFTAPQDFAPLHISEINYNPIGGSGYEFLELKNAGPLPLNLSAVAFTRGVDFTFPTGFSLAPNHFAVLVGDPTAFARRYPGVAVAGAYTGQLANEGEQLRLKAPDDSSILDFSYDDEAGWPTAPDGAGFSLVLANLAGDPALPANWRPSTFPNGSPGADDPTPFSGDILINEVLAHSDPPIEDAIELFNPSTQTIDLSGWFLSDSPSTLQKFRIPDGSLIQPGGFAVFYEYQFNPSPGAPPSFALSSLGDHVFLAAATPAGVLTGYSTSVAFDASPANTSLGRFASSSGLAFPPLARHTFGVDNPATVQQFRTGTGAPNAYPAVGPLVIDELMYNPPPGGHEFVELLNVTDAPVSLFDPANPANTWRFSHGISFTFPANTVIAPRSLALVVGVQPAAFRISYTVPISVPIFGPFADALSNAGERLTLARPDHPAANLVPYLPVDSLLYADAAPWPPQPDGSGPSLERLSGVTFGDDPATWQASLPGGSPGRPNPACFFADVQPNPTHTQPALCDGDVDIADVQRIAACWNQPLASPACPPTLNVDGRGAFVDVADIIAAAQRWPWRR